MNKKYIAILNEFANDHSLAKDIEVVIYDHHKSFKPRDSHVHAKYEDANLLSSIICGAENLIYYLERNGYKIIRNKR